jgi:hypothetical protein
MWCVMLVNVAKVINSCFLDLLACQKIPVWDPAPTSVGKNKFYVSFIDDYSKFAWIFLLKHKSEVFTKFHEFQQHVCDILSLNNDGQS